MPRLDYRSNPERDRNHRCRRRQYRRLVPNYRPICPNRFPYRRHSQNERRGRIGTKLRNSAGNGAVHSVCRRGRPLSPRYLRSASEKSASDLCRYGHHATSSILSIKKNPGSGHKTNTTRLQPFTRWRTRSSDGVFGLAS